MFRRISMLGAVAAIGLSGLVGAPSASAHCIVNVGSCAGHCDVNVGTCNPGAYCTINVGTCTRPPDILCISAIEIICGS